MKVVYTDASSKWRPAERRDELIVGDGYLPDEGDSACAYRCMIDPDLCAQVDFVRVVHPCDGGRELKVGCRRVAIGTQVLSVIKVEVRRQIANQLWHRARCLIEIIKRVLDLEICRNEVVASAGDLAVPSSVTLDSNRLQRPKRVGQVTEALLKKHVAAGPRMCFGHAWIANRQFEGRAY